MTLEELKKLQELNADHRLRILDDPVRSNPLKLERALLMDAASRAALIETMLGCQSRWDLKKSRPRSLLELGAGYTDDPVTPSNNREIICKWLEADDYVGIEVVPDLAKWPDVHCMAIEELPDEWYGRFDFVYSRHVMEHVIDLPLAMRNIRKVLKPHGIVGAVTPHFFPDLEPAHLQKLKIGAWVKAYTDHNMKVVYAQQSTYYVREAHIVAVRSDLPTP